jgi:hypothetical protein
MDGMIGLPIVKPAMEQQVRAETQVHVAGFAVSAELTVAGGFPCRAIGLTQLHPATAEPASPEGRSELF